MSLSVLFRNIINSFQKNSLSAGHDGALRQHANTSKTKRHLYMLLHRYGASYTVEAAILLPLFIMFSVTVFYFLRVEYIQWRVGETMTETVKEITLTEDEVSAEEVSALFLLKAAVEKVPLDKIRFGPLGFDFSGTEVEGSKITFAVDYEVKFPFRIFGRPGLPISQRRTGRIWSGSVPGGEEGNLSYVYVTPYGTAYHRTKYCPYINPSIKSVSVTEVASIRNTGGARYKICPLCGKEAKGICYITGWGTCYHGKLSCSGLKRTIYQVSLDEARIRYHACPKCAQ